MNAVKKKRRERTGTKTAILHMRIDPVLKAAAYLRCDAYDETLSTYVRNLIYEDLNVEEEDRV